MSNEIPQRLGGNATPYAAGMTNMWNIINKCVNKHGTCVLDGVGDLKLQNVIQLYEWLKILSVTDADTNGANTAARMGKISVLKWLHKYKDIRPNHIGMDFAIQNKYSYTLSWGIEHDIFPDDYAIDNLVTKKLDGGSLKCLAVLSKNGKYVSQNIINKLAIDGNIKNLKKIYTATNQLPTDSVFEECVMNNLPKVIKFLLTHNVNPPDIDKLYDIASSNKYKKIIKILKTSSSILSPINNQ